MSIYLKLNQQIDCETLCKKTKQIIDSFIKNNTSLENAILCIEIREISDTQNGLLSLEYRDQN
jgi:acyl CoA:acetate/3-ketoacid CoA transferase alpha subunit